MSARRVRFDVCTLCDLRCPCCVQSRDGMGQIGRGYTRARDFEAFLDGHPEIREVELSNWGEVFLNPELEAILQAARVRGIVTRMSNGVHLNRLTDSQVEAMVHSGVRSITVSIDGCSQAAYARYRIGGNLQRVIDNVRRIVRLRARSGSAHPVLTWQFIVFGHNEQEIEEAEELAGELGVQFRLKLSSDEAFSPVTRESFLRDRLGAASRSEWLRIHGRPYFAPCEQLWDQPQINWDGRLLGCCINIWESFGNVLESGLSRCLHDPRYEAMQRLVREGVNELDDLPCHRCSVHRATQR